MKLLFCLPESKYHNCIINATFVQTAAIIIAWFLYFFKLMGKMFSKQMCASILHFSGTVLAVKKKKTSPDTDGSTDIHYDCSWYRGMKVLIIFASMCSWDINMCIFIPETCENVMQTWIVPLASVSPFKLSHSSMFSFTVSNAQISALR